MSRDIVITRRFEFDAGHRVLNHEGKCRHLHGHRYRADVSLQASALDALGRVIDFGKVKQIIGQWIDEQWDHNLILNPEDPLLTVVIPTSAGTLEFVHIHGQQPYLMPFDDLDQDGRGQNPTAENMAKLLYRVVERLLRQSPDTTGVQVVGVCLYETPNCWADYQP